MSRVYERKRATERLAHNAAIPMTLAMISQLRARAQRECTTVAEIVRRWIRERLAEGDKR